MTFWQRVKAGFGAFWASVFGALVQEAATVIVQQVGAVGAALLAEQAKRLVARADELGGQRERGDFKMDFALEQLKQTAAEQGIVVADRALRKIIEDAVVALKGAR